MQNADREAVKPTTASAALNNSHRATTAAKNASMGLGVSSSGGGGGGGDIGSSSESSDPRVGRFPRRNLGDDRSDGEAAEALWKFEHAKMLAEKAFVEKNLSRKAKGGRLKLNLIRRGTSPQIDDEDDAFQNKSSELTRMISDDEDYDNDQNDDDQINDTILLAKAGDLDAIHMMLKRSGVSSGTSEGDSYLCLAAAAGSLDLCQVLLSYGADVDDRGRKGDCTPLMEAASVGDRRVVQLLCEKGADVNAKSLTGGNTPLHFAACNGNNDVIQILVKYGASAEEHNENGHTPLMDAANTGHISTVRLLLDAGADINAHSNEFKETALTLAAYKGHVEMVDFLLRLGADVEHKTDEMHTALMEAAMDGHVSVAKRLIESGAKINMPEDSFESPLTLAASGGHTELAKLLLSSGANIDEANDEGYTPLMEAVREGHLPLVQFLLDEGANPNAETPTHETPLGLACKAGHTEIAVNLINRGAILEQEAEDGHTGLMKAAKAGHLGTVQYLISMGADINKLSCSNDSALSLACTFGCVDVVEFLLKNGANPIHRLQEGSTVIIEAAKGGHTEVVNLLLTYTNSIQYQQIIPDEQELSQSSPSQTSLDDQTSRVPMQGLGNVVPPQDPTAYQDAQRNFSHVEKQYAGGDRRNDDCMLLDGDKVCGFHSGHGGPCNVTLKNILHSPIGSGCSSSDEDDDDEDDEDEDADADDYEDGDRDEETIKHDLLIKRTMAMSSTELPARWKFEGFPDLSAAAEQIPSKQLLFEKYPDLLRKEQIENLIHCSINKQKNRNHQFPDPLTTSNKPVKATNEFDNDSSEKQIHNGFALMSGDQKPCPKQTLAAASAEQKIVSAHSSLCDCTHKKMTSATENVLLKKKKKKNQLQVSSVIHDSHDDDQLGQSAVKKSLLFEAGHATNARQQIQNRIFAKGNQMFGYDTTPAQRKLSKHDHSILEQLSCQQSHDPPFHQRGGAAMRGDDKPLSSQELLALQVYQNMALQEPLSLDVGQQKQNLAEGCMGHLSGTAESLYNQYHQIIQKFQDPYPLLVSGETIPNVPSPVGADGVLNNDGTPRLGGIDKGAQTLSPYPPQRFLPQNQLIESNLAVDGQGKASGNGVYEYAEVPSSRPLSPSSSLSVVPGFNPLTEMVDVQTEVNHESALSVACAGGFYDLASLLLSKGAKIELKDKKGLTPLLLAASAGFLNIVELLLGHGAEIEAQSDRTKDTALSLACASGRYEVVELLLKRGANKEHRNVSDYTPLSQAASGGYLNVIRLLLSYSAEINSRTGSKLGISPLMLAAMNGHTESVVLLLDNGSDVNAQIETNRNTALTLACFQGRHEVVAVLADRKANLEHRAKTGLTPLMEAATGGYVEVGRVLLEKGADVGAAPVPSSRDTPLTIAADKGHYRFVELLLKHCSPVDVKNKKGATALWLAANGGHLEVVHLLVHAGADVDSQDNRKVSCLVTAFRKGHTKVIKLLVKHVTQYPADQECARYISGLTDNELLMKSKECSEIILSAKELQAEEAEKNADSLLQELQQEKSLVEKKRAAKERKREKKRQKKKEKVFNMKDSLRALADDIDCSAKESTDSLDAKDEFSDETDGKTESNASTSEAGGELKKDGKKCAKVRKTKPRPSVEEDSDSAAVVPLHCPNNTSSAVFNPFSQPPEPPTKAKILIVAPTNPMPLPQLPATISSQSFASVADPNTRSRKEPGKSTTRGFAMSGIGDLDDFTNSDDVKLPASLSAATPHSIISSRLDPKTAAGISVTKSRQAAQSISVGAAKSTRSGILSNAIRSASAGIQKKGQRKDESWKDGSKKMRKIDVPARAVSRVIGRAGCNINAIREYSLARIDLDKLKTSDDAVVTIRGLPEQINQAAELVLGLIRESDKDIEQLIAALKSSTVGGPNVPSGTWKNTSKTTGGSVMASAWDSSTVNVWENRSMKGGNVTQGSATGTTALAVDGKSSNVWTRPSKEQGSLSDVCASNVWDNSMADGIVIGAAAVGTKPAAGGGTVSYGKFVSQLSKQDVQEQQRPATSEDYSKPQPIRSFPIGAWTPVRGHSGGATMAAPERVIPFLSQQNLSLEAPSVTSGDAATCAGVNAEPVNSVSLASEEPMFDGGVRPTSVLFNQSDNGGNRPEGFPPDAGELTSVQPMAASFLNPIIASEKLRHQFQDVAIGEYLPFNNHFSPLAETVIPKKVQTSSHVTFPDLAAPRQDMVVDMALQAKAPGYRHPGQIQRTVSSPGLTDQGDPKVAPGDCDRRNMVTPTFNHTGERPPSPNLGSYSPFSDGIEKASKLALQMNGGFGGPPHSKPDTYITTQSPMLLPRVSSNLNPEAPNFSSRPPIFKPQAPFEAGSVFSVPNYRPAVNMGLVHHPAGLAAIHAANGFVPNSSVKEHLVAQSMGFSTASVAPNNIDPSMMMRRFSLAEDGSQSGQQFGPIATPSVSNPPSPNEDSQPMSSVVAETPFRLRPIGTERTNKRPNSMTGPSGAIPNAGELPPWTFSTGTADWQRQSYIGGAPMPLNIVPNLTQDGLMPMSSSSHHPAMIGHLPIPQQKLLAINNPMYDQSVQIRPNFLVPNGMALSFGGSTMAPHPSLQYPHLPPPSPAPDRAAIETQGNWTSAGLSMSDGADGAMSVCEEERLRVWNIWNGPSNIQNSFL